MAGSLKRRAVLKAGVVISAALTPLRHLRAAGAEATTLQQLDMDVPGESSLAKRARIVISRASGLVDKPRSVLVLLHGLGETHDEQLGLKAWSDLYGLNRACERLLAGRVARETRHEYLDTERLAEINEALKLAPISLPILVCPVTPKPPNGAARSGFFDDYAAWVEQRLLPEVRKLAPARGITLSPRVGLDGCSMGGQVATEVFLRKPELFVTFGTVQSAIGKATATQYAAKLAEALKRVGPRPIHIETSTQDPFRAANEHLCRELTRRSVLHELDVIPGPHTQPWLKEVGTLEMLRWHARQLSA